MVWCWILVAGLSILAVLLVVKIIVMRISAREIAVKLADKLQSETNTLIDITCGDKAMRSLAANLNSQLLKLRSAELTYINGNAELKSSITNISHDLRTPLTAISAYLDLLEGEELPEKAERYISSIRGRVEHLKNITEDLFSFAVATDREEQDNRQSVDIGRELVEVLLAFHPLFEERNIRLGVDILESGVIRQINRDMLCRVLSNIISNAVKYADGELSVKLSERGEMTFQNKTTKLSMVDAERLFDRYYTVESGKKSTGLGLSISKNLMKQMGGKISAEFEGGVLTIKLFF